jgi:hypothetical protein
MAATQDDTASFIVGSRSFSFFGSLEKYQWQRLPSVYPSDMQEAHRSSFSQQSYLSIYFLYSVLT